MQGKRIPAPLNPQDGIPVERPGEYCGPVYGYTGYERLPDGEPDYDKPKAAVFFLKPNSRDPDAPKPVRSVQHVCSPPHTFTEEPDGSLTITPSISDRDIKGENFDGWHGYLTKGVWQKC